MNHTSRETTFLHSGPFQSHFSLTFDSLISSSRSWISLAVNSRLNASRQCNCIPCKLPAFSTDRFMQLQGLRSVERRSRRWDSWKLVHFVRHLPKITKD